MGTSTLNTLEKCVQILTLFTEATPRLSIEEISNRLGLPRSTVYRYIATLKKYQLVADDIQPGVYRLGEWIFTLARAVARSSVQEIALPFMEELQRKYGETVILSALRTDRGVCLEKVEGTHALRVSHDRGAIFPLHAGASGKVLLAYMSPADQARIIHSQGLPRFTKTTITDPDRLAAELARIRNQGYAESNGEVTAGTYGIGAPIFDRRGKVIAALSVAAPAQRLQGRNRTRMIHVVTETAARISDAVQARDV